MTNPISKTIQAFCSIFALRENASVVPTQTAAMNHARFFEQGWLRLSAKIYAGKSAHDMGKAYSRLHKASDNVRIQVGDEYHSSPCLPEVHAWANKEFDLKIYL